MVLLCVCVFFNFISYPFFSIIDKLTGRSINQSVNLSVVRLVALLDGLSVYRKDSKSVIHTVSQPISQSVSQSVSHSCSQSVNQSVTPTVSHC